MGAPDASAQSPGCGNRALTRSAPTSGSAAIEIYADRSGAAPTELRLVRLPPERWTVKVRDMRDLRQAKSRRGDYTSPTFSLAELQSMAAPPRRILASAGMSDSLYAPVPVGLLKSGGVLRSKANPSSRNLDGVLCVRADRRISILSETTAAGRRVPQDIDSASAACAEAVQAGPMLVDKGAPLVGSRTPTRGPRVFAAIDRERRLVIGFSPSATPFDLACTLADASLRIESAIHLQSDALGGVLFGPASGISEKAWGRVDATLASALEIEPR